MTTALGVLAIALNILRSWPQVVGVLRNQGNARGVSALAWSLATGGQLGWMIFGIVEHVYPVIIANTATGLGCFAVLVAIVHRRPSELRTAVITLTPLAIIQFSLLSIGSNAVGSFSVFLSLVMYIPQVHRVLRTSIEGISRLTWSLILLSTLVWAAYGLLVNKPLIAFPTLVIAPLAVVVLIKTIHSRPALQADDWTVIEQTI